MKRLKPYINGINVKSKIFYIIMLASLFITGIFGLVTRGEYISNVLFNHDDVFMDFFNSINNCGDDPYGKYGVIYPPLIVLFYKALSFLFEPKLASLTIRATSLGMLIFFIYTFICLALIIACVFKYKKGNVLDKILFSFVSLTSLPVLYLIERGNVLIFVISLIIVFLVGYDSENKVFRHFAFMCLAIAVAIKIYPVIFGLILLRKNKISNILWCVFYGALFFFVPFLFLGGVSQVFVLVKNILYTSSMFGGNGYGYKVNLTNTFAFIGALVNRPYVFEVIGNAIMILTAVLGVALIVFGKFNQKWKLFAIPCLFMVLVPGFSYVYSIAYMLVALLFFLNDEKKSKLDYVYVVLFALQFMTIFAPSIDAFQVLSSSELNLNVSTVIESFALVAFTVVLYVDVIIYSFKEYKGVKLLKLKVRPIIAICLVGLTCLTGYFSIGYTASKSGFSITNMELWSVDEENEKDLATADTLYDYVEDNIKDKKLVVFPKVDFTSEIDKITDTYFFDTSYYDNSLKNIESVQKKKADYVIIYQVPKYEVQQVKKSFSKTEFNLYYKMNREINQYVLKQGYEQVEEFSINDGYAITVWKKTGDKKYNRWYNKGNGTKEHPYLISTPEQLSKFSKYINMGYSYKNKHIKLTNNIDMAKVKDFEPIGYERYGYSFKGFFDGNGYSIKNLKIVKNKGSKNELNNNVALFGLLNGTVCNLIVENSYFEGKCVSVFARTTHSRVSAIVNCMSKNNELKGLRCGEIADDFATGIWSTLALDNKVDSKYDSGFIGYTELSTNITSCYTNKFTRDSGAGYLDVETMKTNNFVDNINYSAKVFNDRRGLALRNASHFNIRASKKEKKELIDRRIPLSEWSCKDGKLVLSHH